MTPIARGSVSTSHFGEFVRGGIDGFVIGEEALHHADVFERRPGGRGQANGDEART